MIRGGMQVSKRDSLAQLLALMRVIRHASMIGSCPAMTNRRPPATASE